METRGTAATVPVARGGYQNRFALEIDATASRLWSAGNDLRLRSQSLSDAAEQWSDLLPAIAPALALMPDGRRLLVPLETGRLHKETLALLDQFKADSRAPVTVYKPVEEAVVQFVAKEGADAMYKSIELRKACCGVRKLEPLGRALQGQKAWITGLRREQSQARAEVSAQEADVTNGVPILKLNPLVDWTWGDVWHYIALHQVPTNPLHDAFFPSIGCEPCTRPVLPGQHEREGRWWWEEATKKECGLHIGNVEG